MDRKIVFFLAVITLIFVAAGGLKSFNIPGLAVFQGQTFINLVDRDNAFANLSCVEEERCVKEFVGGCARAVIKRNCRSATTDFSYVTRENDGSHERSYVPGYRINEQGKLTLTSETTYDETEVTFNFNLVGKDAQIITIPRDVQCTKVEEDAGICICGGRLGCAGFRCGDEVLMIADRLNTLNYKVQVNGRTVCEDAGGHPPIATFQAKNKEFYLDTVSYNVPFESCRTLPDETFATQDFSSGKTLDFFSGELRIQRLCVDVPSFIVNQSGVASAPEINSRLLAGERLTVPPGQVYRLQFVIKSPGVICNAGDVYSLNYQACINPTRIVSFATGDIINTTSGTLSALNIPIGCPDGTFRSEPNASCVRVTADNRVSDQPCAAGSNLLNGVCTKPTLVTCNANEVRNSVGNCVSAASQINVPTGASLNASSSSVATSLARGASASGGFFTGDLGWLWLVLLIGGTVYVIRKKGGK